MEQSYDTYNHFCLSRPVLCIVGPTASGKTDVSQLIASALDGEIVSADSMQIYIGMDIGTGKISPTEQIVPHHGIDLISPGEPYSAALFQKYARNQFFDIDSRGKRVILCGGTGFYVRAAIDDYVFPEGEQQNNPIRDYYNALASKRGNEAVWSVLNSLDPESAACIHPNNAKRVIRALEMNATGESYAVQARSLSSIEQRVPALFFGLHIEPSILCKRIEQRVHSMVDNGLVSEVELLLSQGFKEGITAPQAIGYKEIVRAIEGQISLEEAIDSIIISTRKYAKRQRSWFRQDKRINWIDATELNSEEVCKEILSQLELL